MGSTQNEIMVVGATQIPVGLSAIIAVRPTAYEYGVGIKISSGGGTLEIAPTPIGYSLSGTGCTGWGAGYSIGGAEAVSIQGPATFYLQATGATMIAAVLIGRTAGATFL